MAYYDVVACKDTAAFEDVACIVACEDGFVVAVVVALEDIVAFEAAAYIVASVDGFVPEVVVALEDIAAFEAAAYIVASVDASVLVGVVAAGNFVTAEDIVAIEDIVTYVDIVRHKDAVAIVSRCSDLARLGDTDPYFGIAALAKDTAAKTSAVVGIGRVAQASRLQARSKLGHDQRQL